MRMVLGWFGARSVWPWKEDAMHTITLEEAQSHLGEIIDKMTPGEEIVLTRGDQPVARIVADSGEKPHPVPGRGKGMLTIIAEDDDHLKDFAEYMP
jgi:antitoxin (DNA-binding transcriptional repressor) of toxin-antitoxin stability system